MCDLYSARLRISDTAEVPRLYIVCALAAGVEARGKLLTPLLQPGSNELSVRLRQRSDHRKSAHW